MPRNGAGTYTLPAGNPVVTQTVISSTWANTTLNDIADALTQSMTKDGQTTPTANMSMAGFHHTNVSNATARTDYASAAQVQDSSLITLSSVSGVDTITATAPLAMSAYATGQIFSFISAGANTGAATININSIGAVAVTKLGTTALSAGDIPSGAVILIRYDGTRFQIIGGLAAQSTVSYPTTIANGGTGQTTAYAAYDALTVQGANIASATTTNIAAATGKSVTITGTTTITGFGTAAAGVERNLTFSGILTLTHNGTSLILPGGSNITTAAGDTAIVLSLGSGNWRMLNYTQASVAPASNTRYVSSYTNYTAANSTYTFAHGLAATPTEFSLYAECTSTDQGWAVGDYIRVIQSADVAGGAQDVGSILYADATNVYVIAPVNGIRLFGKSTRVIGYMTVNKWKLRVVYRV